MSHLCKAAVVTCEDFRLHQRKYGRNVIGRFIQALGEDADLITRGGCIQDLVRPKPGFADSLFRDLEVSVKLHQVEKIYLIGHEDCGAYGHFQFSSREIELAQHFDDLKVAKQLVEAHFPGVAVVPCFAYLQQGTKDQFEIKELAQSA
jgi:hypothetical protein